VQVTLLPDDIGIADLTVSPDAPPRSPGLHQSDLIKGLLQELEPERFSKPLDALRIEMGFAFERMLEEGLKRKFPGIFRPFEIQVEGVAMSPDGYDAASNTLEEFKATWMSSRHGIEDKRFWHWLVQIKGYLYGLTTHTGVEHTTARLRVFWVNGDYKGSGPQLASYRLEFEPREIVENWQMLRNYARRKGLLP